MVEMDVKSKTVAKIVELYLEKEIRKKLGKNTPVDLGIHKLQVKIEDDTAHIWFNGILDVPTDSVYELVKKQLLA